MAVKTDLENCDSNPRGTWFDGCKVAMRDIVKMFLLSPRANLDATDVLSKATIAGLILKAIKDVTGVEIKVKFTTSESGGNQNNTAKDAFEGSLDDNSAMKNKPGKSADEPIITDALEIFGGEIEEDRGKGRR